MRKRWIYFSILAGCAITGVLLVTQWAIVRQMSPDAVISELEGDWTVKDIRAMRHCTGPLKCGEISIRFDLCQGNSCSWAHMVQYSSIGEARAVASVVNGMDCLLGMQAVRRGPLVLGVPCSTDMQGFYRRVLHRVAVETARKEILR
jgi:hypothetical protein